MKFTTETYLNYDPFSGSDRDTDIRCHTTKIVSVRKSQDCMLAPLIGRPAHTIEPGTMARCDRAIVDDNWGSYYCCLDCMDHWLINDSGLCDWGEPHGDLDPMTPTAHGRQAP